MSRVAAIVMAAGATVRLGRPLPLLPWRGRPFVQHIVERAREVGCAPVVVIQGAWPLPGPAVAQGQLIDHPDWDAGPMSSVQVGLRATLKTPAEAVLIIEVDQPHLQARSLVALIEAQRHRPDAMVRAVASGVGGRPFVVPRVIAEAMLELDPGLPIATTSLPGEVMDVDVDDPAVAAPIDTVEDIRRLPP